MHKFWHEWSAFQSFGGWAVDWQRRYWPLKTKNQKVSNSNNLLSSSTILDVDNPRYPYEARDDAGIIQG